MPNFFMTLRKPLLAACLASAAGCTSLRSTMINRYEDDTFAGNSNGELKRHDMARPYRGVPITIKVPTHVDVKILEKSFLYSDGGALRELNLSTPHREVELTTIETDKVFIVDFKRPLSGTLKYNATFGSDQYFNSISGKLEDTTITDVAALVATVAPMLAKPAAGEGKQNNISDELITNQRLIAYRRFDIDAPDFEMQVRCFLDEHLNCGHTCSGSAEPLTTKPIEPDVYSVPFKVTESDAEPQASKESPKEVDSAKADVTCEPLPPPGSCAPVDPTQATGPNPIVPSEN